MIAFGIHDSAKVEIEITVAGSFRIYLAFCRVMKIRQQGSTTVDVTLPFAKVEEMRGEEISRISCTEKTN